MYTNGDLAVEGIRHSEGTRDPTKCINNVSRYGITNAIDGLPDILRCGYHQTAR